MLTNEADALNDGVLSYKFPFVTRCQWQARSPLETVLLATPVPYVVIHHSYEPSACYDREECSKAMRQMQNMHMDDRIWEDVGYNFAIGSDGVVYEGRGWTVLGTHALFFNAVSIGICLIGDWRFTAPPIEQLKSAKELIATGVELGFVHPNYKLLGHRQVRETECPGEALYQEIQTWDHYSTFPSSARDLINVKEISDTVKELILRNEIV